jgi:putative ABC transport system permease protein
MEAESNVTAVSRWSRPRSTTAIGIDGDWFAIKNLELKDGRPFTDQELSQGENVLIIGPDMVERAFPGLDPLGREVRIGGVPYRVIGVTESRGSAFGISFDNFVIGPWRSPLRKLLNPEPQMIDAVIVQTSNPESMTEAQERVRAVMRTRRGLRPGQKDNFSMETSASALEFWNKIEAKLQLFGVALPVVGLVVGAIVIMNIMLVAVAERTFEIGIRKSLGARKKDILNQFLVESATLATIGAALGVLLGIGFAKAIAAVSPLPAAVEIWSIFVGVGVGAGVGIIAGIYPASRAALLDPVAAMRHEN